MGARGILRLLSGLTTPPTYISKWSFLVLGDLLDPGSCPSVEMIYNSSWLSCVFYGLYCARHTLQTFRAVQNHIMINCTYINQMQPKNEKCKQNIFLQWSRLRSLSSRHYVAWYGCYTIYWAEIENNVYFWRYSNSIFVSYTVQFVTPPHIILRHCTVLLIQYR